MKSKIHGTLPGFHWDFAGIGCLDIFWGGSAWEFRRGSIQARGLNEIWNNDDAI